MIEMRVVAVGVASNCNQSFLYQYVDYTNHDYPIKVLDDMYTMGNNPNPHDGFSLDPAYSIVQQIEELTNGLMV